MIYTIDPGRSLKVNRVTTEQKEVSRDCIHQTEVLVRIQLVIRPLVLLKYRMDIYQKDDSMLIIG